MSIPQSGGGPIERHEQLAEYLANGCKPKEDWRIGTEHEKFGYCKDTLKPLPYEGERSITRCSRAARPLWLGPGRRRRQADRPEQGRRQRQPRAGWRSWNCRAHRSRRSTRPATR